METSPSPVLDPTTVQAPVTCGHTAYCGGCSRQSEAYSEQLARKETLIRTALQEIPVGLFHPILSSPETFYYRNKMEFSFGDNFDRNILNLPAPEGTVHVGLHPKGRFSLTSPTPECRLLSKDSTEIMKIVGEWATEFSIPVYVRPKHRGVLRHLVIREGKNTNERLVMLVSTTAVTHVDVLKSRLQSSGIPITTFLWARHDGLSDVARGTEVEIGWGEGWIREKLGRIEFRVSPHSFMQTNTHAAERLIKVLRSWIQEGKILLDLYCGAGTIGLNLADLFERVIGMECEPESVANARETAERNGITNANFESGRVEKLLDKFPHDRAQTICVVDPPRAGLHPDVVKALAASQFTSIIYVSCNPISLAKDLKGLEVAYAIKEVQPMDFFPHTDHMETAVFLSIRVQP